MDNEENLNQIIRNTIDWGTLVDKNFKYRVYKILMEEYLKGEIKNKPVVRVRKKGKKK